MCLAVPGKLLERLDDDPLVPMGRVDFGGVFRDVCLACVPSAEVGDHVLVHVGMALQVIDAKHAAATFEALRELTLLEDES